MTVTDADAGNEATTSASRTWETVVPVRLGDVEVGPTEKNYEGTMTVLKSRRSGQYVRLPEADFWLWTQMDGQTTLRELVVKLFVEYQHFDPERVQRLYVLLGERGFLAEYDGPSTDEQAASNGGRARRFGWLLDSSRLRIPHADRLFTRLYRGGGWMLFSSVGLALGVGLFVMNAVLFPHYFFTHEIHILAPYGSYRWGLVSAMIMVAASIFAHELGHGLATKYFGREVTSAGFMLILGLPAFFVDTTDMWMRSKWSRIAVSWAGPYTNAVLSGLCMLILHYWHPGHRDGLFLFATINMLIGIYSLVPVMEKDGDYILMDLLGMPNLRSRAFRYVSRDFWAKMATRQAFGFMDMVLLAYGLLAVGGLIWYTLLSVRLWEITIEELVRDVIAYPLLTLEIVLPALILALGVYLARKTVLYRRKSSTIPVRMHEPRLRGD